MNIDTKCCIKFPYVISFLFKKVYFKYYLNISPLIENDYNLLFMINHYYLFSNTLHMIFFLDSYLS
jgi:hypothetical protein